jgi:hypothetical protein
MEAQFGICMPSCKIEKEIEDYFVVSCREEAFKDGNSALVDIVSSSLMQSIFDRINDLLPGEGL